ncbi:MAG: glycosyltransferase family 39 protein [Chloroflexota bacterium]
METNRESPPTPSWLDRPLFHSLPHLTPYIILIAVLIGLTLFSRFYILGERVMSHDEVNHVVPSYDLSIGKGYRHDPVTHGPVQFHLVALSYFLFGANDFTSRIPAALYSVATVLFVTFGFRRYLGKIGSLIGGYLFLISPYLLFYGRYTRNEAFVALYAVLTLFAVLRYLEKGEHKMLYLLTAVTALQFATKETAYIYTAQLLIFLAFLFMDRIGKARWENHHARRLFMTLLSGALLLLIFVVILAGWNAIVNKDTGEIQQAVGQSFTPIQIIELGGVIVALVLAVIAVVILLRNIGWNALKQDRSFDMLMLIGSLILPLLTAFPVKIIGSLLRQNWNPIDYSPESILRTGIFLVAMTAIAFGIGFLWKPRLWLVNFAIFYGIFTVFYTTFFTNGFGFFTGIIGSLGYWLEQQGVHRGEQPFYYYILIQLPIYEFLALFGTLLAIYFGTKYNLLSAFAAERLSAGNRRFSPQPVNVDVETESSDVKTGSEDEPSSLVFNQERPLPILALFLFWSFTALIAYSIAGEKMPWLTVHIAVPFLISAAWGFGYLVETTPWHKLKEQHGWLALILVPVALSSLSGLFGSLLGPQPPFQGNTLEQLQSTSAFVFSLLAFGFSVWGILRLLRDWTPSGILRLFVAGITVYLAVLTARTAFTANYINYDTAKEFLVYAHAARGPKDILAQVEEISRRTTSGKNINVAYDNDALYPYWWYFRDYPNKRYFTDNVTRDLRESPIIIAGENNWSRLDSITRGYFQSFEYQRLWWPMQDYYNLTWQRIWDALRNPAMRSALFKIWRDRDYTEYAQLTNNPNLTLETWQPSQKLKMYIRNDILAQIWNYGAAPSVGEPQQTDPYVSGIVNLTPDQVIGQPGSGVELGAPRKITFAPDGTMYVADTGLHQILHFSPDGQLLHRWGSFANVAEGEAPGGTFYEPWGIAVAPDGSVFVADTWNHRIQKFTADGQFVTMWGFFGQGVAPEAFWGPRDLAFDSKGRLFVTDTGNKRIVIFDQNGNYIDEFGSAGIDPGQFDEQVGIAINAQDQIFVTDTWNQRVQVFQIDPQSGKTFFVREWQVVGWFGQSLDNKPYIAVDNKGNVFITDPEGYRVIQFTEEGQFVRTWGTYSTGIDGFGLAAAVAVDSDGHVWVSDPLNRVLLRFTMP